VDIAQLTFGTNGRYSRSEVKQKKKKIKAMQRIEKKQGYEIETVLNSMFCYKLPERAPDSEPPPVSWLVVGCKGKHNLK